MNKHDLKKFFDLVNFWPVAGIFCTSKFSEHPGVFFEKFSYFDKTFCLAGSHEYEAKLGKVPFSSRI